MEEWTTELVATGVGAWYIVVKDTNIRLLTELREPIICRTHEAALDRVRRRQRYGTTLYEPIQVEDYNWQYVKRAAKSGAVMLDDR